MPSREASTDSLVHVEADQVTRSAAIEEAARRKDARALETYASEPGGFEDNELRQAAWPVLLGRSDSSAPVPSTSQEAAKVKRRHGKEKAVEETQTAPVISLKAAKELPPHPDEGQVKLDVDRSFVNFLDDQGPAVKAKRREELQDIIVAVLRSHPSLNYFQGFHDIVSVLLLILDNADLTFDCVERMSLFRIRDSMGKTIEPVMGYLRLLKRIVHAADPHFASIVDQAAHLPYFSLSWVLTLLSHDLPDLASSARLFDFLLAYNPAMVAYLAAALILEKRRDVDQLQEDPEMMDDPAMLHTTLSKLPPLAPSTVASSTVTHSRRSSTSSASLVDQVSIASLPTDPGYSSDIDVDMPSIKPATPPPPIVSPPIALSVDVLVSRTLDLWRAYPLDNKAIAASELLGPNSCIYTWERGISVEEAEAIVASGDGVVIPVPEPPRPVVPPIKRVKPVVPLLSTWLLRHSIIVAAFSVAGIGVGLALMEPRRYEQFMELLRPMRAWWSSL